MQMFFRYFLLGICAVLVPLQAEDAGGNAPEAFRLIFEAEAFDGLPFYGNWYSKEGIGWYTKEHRHALSRAVVVCDEQNREAEMLKRLAKLIPAGEFKIFLRVLGTPSSWSSEIGGIRLLNEWKRSTSSGGWAVAMAG